MATDHAPPGLERGPAERAYEWVVMSAAAVVVALMVVPWFSQSPDLTPLSIAALACVPIAVRTQITISRGEPDLTLGASVAALYAADFDNPSSILPIWALLVAGSYLAFYRDETWGQFRAAIQVLGGAALVTVASHVDFGLRPYDRGFVSLAVFFATITALEMLRRPLVRSTGGQRESDGSILLHLRWTYVLLVGTGIFYVSASVATLRRLIDDEPVPLVTSLLVLAIGLVAVVIGLAVHDRRLARSLRAVSGAAVSMPWQRDVIEETVTSWARAGMRTDDVTVQLDPGRGSDISARMVERHLVARRAPGDLPFTVVEREVLDALASMAVASERRAVLDEHLTHQAQTDHLTGLLSFEVFRARLDEVSLTRSPGEHLGIMFLDLDEFKVVNDTYGHLVGDTVIKTIASRLRGAAGEGSLVCRFGGDEFAVLVRDVVDADDLAVHAERLLARVREPVWVSGQRLFLDASAGWAISSHRSDDMGQVIAEADRAMYGRKGQRRSRAEEADDLAEAVRDAIVNGRLGVVYQPVVNIPLGRMRYWEALVRLDDPIVGVVSPTTVVATASRLHLLDDLTRHVVDDGVSTILAVRAVAKDPSQVSGFSVNLELEQVQTWSPLLQHIVESIAEHEIHIGIELSERTFDEWGPETREVTERLVQSGVQIAMDDFGTGYAAIGALFAAPTDVIKVDRSLVEHLEDPRQLLLLRRLVEMLHELDFVIVVEGIESLRDVKVLEEIDVTRAQGYLFGCPVPRDEVVERVRRHGLAMIVT